MTRSRLNSAFLLGALLLSPQVQAKTKKAEPPEKVIPPSEDVDARRRVAGGAISDDVAAKLDDPELQIVAAAEQVLFPRVLQGAKMGWSWSGLDGAHSASQGTYPWTANTEQLAQLALEDGAEEEWLAGLLPPDLPAELEGRVLQYLRFYRDSSRGKSVATIWAKKLGRYSQLIRTVLTRAGLPRDLLYLSLIESGHNPAIRSPVGAAGLWQFMPDTGRMYGLRVDKSVDERLDPELATEAAAKFLGDLYRRFGSWELAMAAYNMGHAGLLRSVRQFNTNNFWQLTQLEAALPYETALYVPKILAIATVMKNRRAFGIEQITADPAVDFETLHIKDAVDLKQIAALAGVQVESIVALNPHILGTQLAAVQGKNDRPWTVHIPSGTAEKVASQLHSNPSQHGVYVVRFGDTAEAVAKEYGVDVKVLNNLNHHKLSELSPGSVISVPRVALRNDDGKAPVALPFEPEDSKEYPLVFVSHHSRTAISSQQMRIYYRTIGNETIGDIAAAFNQTEEELRAVNRLDKRANLPSGLVLEVIVPSDASLSAVRYYLPHQVLILESGSAEFTAYFSGDKPRHRIVVAAKKGDTLAKIGGRYHLSSGMMERINHFSRNQKLEEGEAVIVYSDRAADRVIDGSEATAINVDRQSSKIR